MKLLAERITGKPRERDYWEMYSLMDEMYSEPREPRTYEQILYEIVAQRMMGEYLRDLPKEHVEEVWKEVEE